MSKILRDPVHVIREKMGVKTLNWYAKVKENRVARSVADKFQREKTCFLSSHFGRQFQRDFAILLSKLNTTRCHRRKENRRISFLLQ